MPNHSDEIISSEEPNTPLENSAKTSYWNKMTKKKAFAMIFFVVAACFFTLVPQSYKLNWTSEIDVIRFKNKANLEVTINKNDKSWVRLSSLPNYVKWSVIAAEDSKFYHHYGFDFYQIRKSIESNFKQKRYVRGASTISQQLIKVAFLSPEKSIIRKLREAFGTVLLEAFVTKNDILEWYLNLVEFGHDTYGIHKAAYKYFQKHPTQLTLNESIYLSSILPSPRKWSRHIRDRSLSEFLQKRFSFILKQMYIIQVISKEQWESGLLTGNFGLPIDGAYEQITDLNEKLCEKKPENCILSDDAAGFESFHQN